MFNIVLLTIVTMLHIRSPNLSYKWNFIPFDQHLPAYHQSILFLWVWLFYIPYISEIKQYFSFSAWLTSHTIMTSKSIHILMPFFLMVFCGPFFHFPNLWMMAYQRLEPLTTYFVQLLLFPRWSLTVPYFKCHLYVVH